MSEDQTKVYVPHQRDFYELDDETEIRSYSETDSTILPNPVTDPIVSMNISNVEFDYTYDGGQEIPDTDD
ncbi:MAG TPA: hypothetical protein VIM70_17450 [Clostridium sp.]|uniref:hypothetical protein n=1 Tax=Clostridium sp. TaxID=1506 RepID=UPI002F9476B9